TPCRPMSAPKSPQMAGPNGRRRFSGVVRSACCCAARLGHHGGPAAGVGWSRTLPAARFAREPGETIPCLDVLPAPPPATEPGAASSAVHASAGQGTDATDAAPADAPAVTPTTEKMPAPQPTSPSAAAAEPAPASPPTAAPATSTAAPAASTQQPTGSTTAAAEKPAAPPPAASSSAGQPAASAASEQPAAPTPAAAEQPPAPPPVDPVVAEVRRLLAQPLKGSSERADRAALTAFYAARTDPPLWVGSDGFTARARHAMAEIRRADDWGLSASAFE